MLRPANLPGLTDTASTGRDQQRVRHYSAALEPGRRAEVPQRAPVRAETSLIARWNKLNMAKQYDNNK
jgi:hypothetical protein